MSTSNNGIYNTVGASISGVTNTLTITNPSNTASSAARETIVVGGGSAGDPTINWNVSGVTNFEMGLDNSDSDKLKISQGTALGTNDTWVMDTSGRRTMPLQPCFRAYLSATQNNVTGDGSLYNVIFDTVVFDQGSNYNNGNGKFTAPINGKYFFYSNIFWTNIPVGCSSTQVSFIVNGTAATRFKTGNVGTLQASGLLLLNATDFVQIEISAGSSTKTASIFGSQFDTFFFGYLVC